MKDVGLVAALGCGNVQYLVNFVLIPVFNIVNLKLDRIKRFVCYIFMSQGSLEIIAVTELELNILDFYFVVVRAQQYIIRKSKFPQNPKRSVRFSGKRTKRSVQKRKARNTQKAETKVL